jgi:hypothetical protein
MQGIAQTGLEEDSGLKIDQTLSLSFGKDAKVSILVPCPFSSYFNV